MNKELDVLSKNRTYDLVNLPPDKRLIKTAAKKSAAKKAKVVKVVPDSSIIEVEPLDKELDDTTTLSNLTRKVDEQKQILSGIIEALEAEDRLID